MSPKLPSRRRLLIAGAVVSALVVAAAMLLFVDEDDEGALTKSPPSSDTTTSTTTRPGRPEGTGGGRGEGAGRGGNGSPDSGGSADPSEGATPPPPPVGGDTLPLGSLTLTGDSDPMCPSGWTCPGFTVSCPDVERDQLGWFWIGSPQAATRGLVAFFSGAGGNDAWTQGSALAEAKLEQLRGHGFEVVQVLWRQKGWLNASLDEQAGPARLACKPATAVAWLHDERFAPMGVEPGPGRCGFCITGNSGGASQISYTVSHYGLADRIDALIPTSGPPHAALTKGCLRNAGEEGYWYPGAAGVIDASYGFQDDTGPCVNHDPSWTGVWNGDSVDLGGSAYRHLTTRVHFLVPDTEDGVVAATHGMDFRAQLQQAGSPWVREQVVAGMGHDIYGSESGLDALEAAILAGP